jgi:hypothetical protein
MLNLLQRGEDYKQKENDRFDIHDQQPFMAILLPSLLALRRGGLYHLFPDLMVKGLVSRAFPHLVFYLLGLLVFLA